MRILLIGAPGSTHCIAPLQRAGEQIVGFVMSRSGKHRAAPQGRLVEILFMLARLWVILEVGILRRVPVYQTSSVRDPVFMRWVTSLNPDLIVIFSCNQIIPEEIITLPRCGCINVHPSLLPKYRGAHPHFWVLVKGEAVTGVTVHYVDVGVDSGDIVIQQVLPIHPRDTMFSLNERLNQLGARLLVKAVQSIRNGTAPRIPQDHARASYFPPLRRKVGLINWEAPAPEIIRLIRTLNPKPGQLRNPKHLLRYLRLKLRPYTYYGPTELEIKQATEWATDGKPRRPGQILSVRPGQGIAVATGDGTAILINRYRLKESHAGGGALQVGDVLGRMTSGKEVGDGARVEAAG
jgi:methionyl-tRNA formyltransferase